MRTIPLLFSLSFGCAYVTDKEYKDRLAAAGDAEDCETFLVFYADADGDGFGNPNNPIQACSLGDGMAQNSDDCNDADPLQKPGGQTQFGAVSVPGLDITHGPKSGSLARLEFG